MSTQKPPQDSPAPKAATVIDLAAKREEKEAAAEAASGEKKRKKKDRENTPEHYFCDFALSQDWAVEVDKQTGAQVMYAYTGKFWKAFTHEDQKNAAEVFLSTRFATDYTASRRDSCVKLLSSALARGGKFVSFDKNRPLIAVRGGVLEITHDGSILLHGHGLKLPTRVYVDVDIDCFCIDQQGFYVPDSNQMIEDRGGLFSKFVKDSFADVDVRRAWQEHFGDTLIPIDSQATAFLIGNGGQGKSQWGHLLKALHPQYAIADLSSLRGFNLQSFISASLLIVDEVEKKIDEAAFKRIFGGGMGVQVERKYEAAINWTPTIKGVCFVNSIPVFAEHSEGMARRIRPYPMSVARHNSGGVVPDIGRKIVEGYVRAGAAKGQSERVPSELKDVLDWALNGAVEVMRRGRLRFENEMPQACKDEKEDMRESTDPVYSFMRELDFQPVSHGGTSKEGLYEAYASWCKKGGRSPMNVKNFGSDFKRNFKHIHGADLREMKVSVRVPVHNPGAKFMTFTEGRKNGFNTTAREGGEYPSLAASKESVDAYVQDTITGEIAF